MSRSSYIARRARRAALLIPAVPVVLILATQVATAKPSARGIAFKVRLTGELFESRHFSTSKTSAEGCKETTTGGGSLAIRFRTAKPSSVVVRRSPHGYPIYSPVTIRHVAVGVSQGGSAYMQSCPPIGSYVTDCTEQLLTRGHFATSFSSSAPGELVFDQLRPRLPSAAPCSFGMPKTLPPLGLLLAKGQLSEEKLFNPKVKVLAAEGQYDVRLPVDVADGTAELVQRVHWRLTFTRVRRAH